MKVEVVIPHHLPSLDFLEEWKQEFSNPDVHIIIVEDKPTRKTTLPSWALRDNPHGYTTTSTSHVGISIYTHEDIDKDLGDDSWIIPRGTSAIRSYGLYKAWQRKPDMIVTLDNDCFPDGSKLIEGHWNNLEQNATLDWFPSTPEGYASRGFPYEIRNKSKTYVSHGVWSNIPDLDAAQMLQMPDLRTKPASRNIVIPRYNFYPMCGMNLAFRPEVTPLMYFGLFGEIYGFDQFDDIWAGIFSKKVMDYLGWAVRSGYPSVEHRKQSNAFVNFKKQAGGMQFNEELWKAVQAVELNYDDPIRAYRELLQKVKFPEGDYWIKVRRATTRWLDLFTV